MGQGGNYAKVFKELNDKGNEELLDLLEEELTEEDTDETKVKLIKKALLQRKEENIRLLKVANGFLYSNPKKVDIDKLTAEINSQIEFLNQGKE